MSDTDVMLYPLTKQADGTFTVSYPVPLDRDEATWLSEIGNHIVRKERVRVAASAPLRDVKVYIEPLNTIEIAYVDQLTMDELSRG